MSFFLSVFSGILVHSAGFAKFLLIYFASWLPQEQSTSQQALGKVNYDNSYKTTKCCLFDK